MTWADPLARQVRVADFGLSLSRPSQGDLDRRRGIIAHLQAVVAVLNHDADADGPGFRIDHGIDEGNTAQELLSGQGLHFCGHPLPVANGGSIVGKEFQHQPEGREVCEPINRLAGLDVISLRRQPVDNRAVNGGHQFNSSRWLPCPFEMSHLLLGHAQVDQFLPCAFEEISSIERPREDGILPTAARSLRRQEFRLGRVQLGRVEQGQIVALVDHDSRVVGVKAIESSVDVSRERLERPFVVTQTPNCADLARCRQELHGRRLYVGDPTRCGIDPNRARVATFLTVGHGNQFHAADGATSRLAEGRRAHHGTDVEDVLLAKARLLCRACSAARRDPAEPLGRPECNDDQDSGSQEEQRLEAEDGRCFEAAFPASSVLFHHFDFRLSIQRVSALSAEG